MLHLKLTGHKSVVEAFNATYGMNAVNMNDLECPGCKAPMLHITHLEAFGDYLLIQLDRFNEWGNKINSPMEISDPLRTKLSNGTEMLLDLRAVICHLGTRAGSGHYIAAVKTPTTNGFALYNDAQKVLPYSLKSAEETAYMLLYKRVPID